VVPEKEFIANAYPKRSALYWWMLVEWSSFAKDSF
jgi:hypothetical protein